MNLGTGEGWGVPTMRLKRIKAVNPTYEQKADFIAWIARQGGVCVPVSLGYREQWEVVW